MTSKTAAINAIIAHHTFSATHEASRVSGKFVVGQTMTGEALCLGWQQGKYGHVDAAMLRAMFEEARALGLRGPIHVYAASVESDGAPAFYFCQRGRTAAQHTTAELTWIGRDDQDIVFCSAESASQPGRVNTVSLDTTTGETVCDCRASAHGLMCWHRDLIRARYIEETARQYVALYRDLDTIAAIGRQARALIDAGTASDLDRAMYQAARVAWHARAGAPACGSAAPALALAA